MLKHGPNTAFGGKDRKRPCRSHKSLRTSFSMMDHSLKTLGTESWVLGTGYWVRKQRAILARRASEGLCGPNSFPGWRALKLRFPVVLAPKRNAEKHFQYETRRRPCPLSRAIEPPTASESFAGEGRGEGDLPARCTPSPFPSPPKHRILNDKPFSGERGPLDAVVVGSDFLAEPEGAAQKCATSKRKRRA